MLTILSCFCLCVNIDCQPPILKKAANRCRRVTALARSESASFSESDPGRRRVVVSRRVGKFRPIVKIERGSLNMSKKNISCSAARGSMGNSARRCFARFERVFDSERSPKFRTTGSRSTSCRTCDPSSQRSDPRGGASTERNLAKLGSTGPVHSRPIQRLNKPNQRSSQASAQISAENLCWQRSDCKTHLLDFIADFQVSRTPLVRHGWRRRMFSLIYPASLFP
jgi:hypothetical protein